MERRDRDYWLWVGGGLVAVSVTCLAIAGGLLASRTHYPFWTSAPMLVAYGSGAAALGCLWSAVRGVRFPFATTSGPAHPSGRGYGPVSARVSYVRDYLEVAIVNDGLTLGSASINLLVPDFFSRMWRWEARRTPSPKGTMLRTSEALDGLHESIYWAETGIRLPGRMTTLMHFHLSGRQPGEHAFKLKVIADELDDDFVLAGTFVIAERTESF